MDPRKKRPTELVDMASLMSGQGVEALLLSQIAGPGRRRKLRVLPLQEVVLGRDEDCEIILDDDPVSRRHAKVLYAAQQAELLDLGSTNGTFLNGKPVHRAFLKHGDQIQVGATIFEVSIGEQSMEVAPSSSTVAQRVELQIRKKTESPSPKQSTAISGNLSEIKLSSLLQIIETDRSTGTLVIRTAGQEGKLHVHQGVVRHATLGRARGTKALYRMMVCEDGRFDFFIPGRSPEFETIEGGLQQHLLEAMRQKDELAHYTKQLPPAHVRLAFNPEKAVAPYKVPPAVFDVIAAVGHYKTVEKTIEHSQLPDFEIAKVLLILLRNNVLKVEDTSRDAAAGVKENRSAG